MHTFDEYAPTSDAQLIGLIRAHPFALVVSSGADGPVASHVPVIPDPSGDDGPGGLTLWGHMARVNPQWREFSSGRPVLVVFQGAHSYVSAALYERTPAVPTWNYSAVHVTAVPTVITDPATTLDVLTATVAAAEAQHGTAWDMTASVGHFTRIMSGVVAFTLHVTAVQGVLKLSQDKPDVLWERVHAGLSGNGDTGSAQVAADMAAVRPGRAGQPG